MISLIAEPLTANAFAAYGDVIEMAGHEPMPMNYGMAERYHALATVLTDQEGHAAISLVKSRRYELPHQIKLVERHPFGSQAFIPLDSNPFIVIVAPAGEQVNPGDVRAFVTNGEQGINYRPGIWHGLLFTPADESRFVCVDRQGPGNNCEEYYFAEEQSLWLQLKSAE